MCTRTKIPPPPPGLLFILTLRGGGWCRFTFFFRSSPCQAVQTLPVFEHSIDLNFGSEHYSVRAVVVRKIMFQFLGVCLVPESSIERFSTPKFVRKSEYLVANEDSRENHATSTFFVEFLSRSSCSIRHEVRWRCF